MAINFYAFGILFLSIIALACAVLFWNMMKAKRKAKIEREKKIVEEYLELDNQI